MRSILLRLQITLLGAGCILGQETGVRTQYTVRHVGQGILYIDGGSNDGLAEGMSLRIIHHAPGAPQLQRAEIARVKILATTSNSAGCELSEGTRVEAGDIAELSEADAEAIKISRTSRSKRKYAQVISFTEGDPIEVELREYVPHPPLPEVNRIRGRVSFEQNGIIDHTGGGSRITQEGVVLRADMTRIAGTYWNFTGYWRGRMSSTSRASEFSTLNDLLSRTYHIGLYYNNPESRYSAGFGRLFIPYATSLSTIDGGYVARRMSHVVTAGIFAGSTPDPTAWNYDPNRRIMGVFTAFEKGSFEGVRYTGTVGAALSRHGWLPERQFLFFENNLFLHDRFSIFHNLEADKLDRTLVSDGKPRPRIARSFLTMRLQATRRLSFDISHNYFRGVPTFDERLIATGLLDKLLFQGWNGGFRLDLPHAATLYGNLGTNKREEERKVALNYMGGLVLGHVPKLPFRTDIRYSRFTGSFASGRYQSVSFSREVTERLRLELLLGQQNLASAATNQSRTRYLNTTIDYLVGGHYVLGGGWTLYRGRTQMYDQYFLNLGYRF